MIIKSRKKIAEYLQQGFGKGLFVLMCVYEIIHFLPAAS